VLDHCPVCDQRPIVPGRQCGNYWCARADRGFNAVWAVGSYEGRLRRTILSYKYGRRRGLARPLGQLLARYLLDHLPWFDAYELLLPVPAHAGGSRGFDHMAAILKEVAQTDVGGLWPVAGVAGAGAEPSPLVKVADTVALSLAGSDAARRLWAATELRTSLVVRVPERVRGRRLLVVDDVMTDGSTLREVALVLLRAGAKEVSGLVLARQPWRRRPTPAPPDVVAPEGVF